MSLRKVLHTLSTISAGQWGMLTTAQAASAGVSRVQLTRLTQQGLLERLAQGVYRNAGSTPGEFDEVRAAWLSTDPRRTAAERVASSEPGAVVGGSTAAFLLGFGDLQPAPYEFATSVRRQSQRPDIRYRHRPLSFDDLTIRAGLPTTTIERTIADLLGDHHDLSLVADVLADAIRHSAVDLTRLASLLEPFAARYGHAKGDGSALLRRLLELGGVDAATQLRRITTSPVWRGTIAAEGVSPSPAAIDGAAIDGDAIAFADLPQLHQAITVLHRVETSSGRATEADE